MILLGTSLGIGLTLAALTLMRGGGEGVPVGTLRPACGISIVLFEVEGAESKLIDAATGGHGFSLVAIDGCEADDQGRPLLIDCRPGLGVARVPLDDYGNRGRVRIWLPRCEGRELYGCVRGRVGQPYDALGLIVPKAGPVGGLVCSQLVYECLPAKLRQRVPPWPAGRPIAPNDLAQGFGVVLDDPDVVLQ